MSLSASVASMPVYAARGKCLCHSMPLRKPAMAGSSPLEPECVDGAQTQVDGARMRLHGHELQAGGHDLQHGDALHERQAWRRPPAVNSERGADLF